MEKFKSPLDAVLYWEGTKPNANFFKQPANGKVIEYKYAEVIDQVRRVATGLKALGLPERSHIAIMSLNCAHWCMADLAIMMAGYVSVPVYPTLNSDGVNLVLTHSEAKAIFIGKLYDFETQKEGIPDIPIISVELFGKKSDITWESLVESNAPIEKPYQLKEEDLLTIIYTSGTTGNPKGVMHSVGNFNFSAETFTNAFKLPENSRMFSYLPLAHVAERCIANAGYVVGAEISFTESLETFAGDLQRTEPHLFFAVPRIWTKFQGKILESLPQKKLSMLLSIPLVSGLIKKKIKKKLGLSHAKLIYSGAAPLAVSLIKWYRKLGITIYQVYGMTEDCCVSHCNLPGKEKIGTVGKPLDPVKFKLSEEGEICVKNPCLMKGYFKNPDATAATFTEDGYLRTGDVGEYDHDGYLSITGRVKDKFKTDKGKYISPAPLELELSKNTDIEQICIVGTGIPQPIALVTLSETGKLKDKLSLSLDFEETLAMVNPQFEKHEKIEKVIIMKEEWNVENGLTTPSLKVKRNVIEKIHQPYYLDWFNSDDKVIFE
jgi:long-chain acyl-CoA synthetase